MVVPSWNHLAMLVAGVGCGVGTPSENDENGENGLGLWLGGRGCVPLVKMVKIVLACGWVGGCVPR